MKLTLLGTSGMLPTATRNVSSAYVHFVSRGFLFDCGEGTQRQLSIAKLNRNSISYILISHWHGDHVWGLLPLLQSCAQMKRTIHIFGPKETKKRLEHLFKATYFDSQLDIVVVEIDEATPKLVYEENDFSVYAMNVFHSIPCVAYSLIEKDKRRINVRAAAKLGINPGPVMQEFVAGKSVKIGSTVVSADEVTYGVKGKKISYVVDTIYDESIVELVRGSTVLVSEATYDASQKEKAQEHAHMTSVDAAMLAKNAECGTLVLTHVSSRYKDAKVLEKEACEVFTKTYCGADFFTLTF